ncbi:MAG: ABC transporter permease, partial [Acidimicrobiales bacterium]
MTATAVPLSSHRRVAWLRRRRALARTWAQYRSSKPGMLGLVILLVFVAMALIAPLISDSGGLVASN